MIDPLVIEWRADARADTLLEAFAFVEDWHEFHFGANARSTSSSWTDMATGIRALWLAFFADLLAAGRLEISSKQIKKLYRLVDAHALRLRDPASLTLSNHGLFQVFGLNLLAIVCGDRPACREGTKYAKEAFLKIFRSQFTAESVHREHSPEYHWTQE